MPTPALETARAAFAAAAPTLAQTPPDDPPPIPPPVPAPFSCQPDETCRIAYVGEEPRVCAPSDPCHPNNWVRVTPAPNDPPPDPNAPAPAGGASDPQPAPADAGGASDPTPPRAAASEAARAPSNAGGADSDSQAWIAPAAILAAAIATHVLFGDDGPADGAGFAARAPRAPRVDFRAAFDSDRESWRAGWRVRF